MKHLVSTTLLFYACSVYGQTQTTENVLSATQASNNVAVNVDAGTYRYSFQTGQVSAVGPLPQYDPTQILTLNWSFQALYDCNNSIGGYCGDPNGIEDEIQAFLGVGNLAGDYDLREVFNRRDFNQEWQTFTGTEVYDFGTAYEAATLTLEGVDRGFWAGNYGPAVRNPSVVAIYTPLNAGLTAPDCTNPQNDPSCDGYTDDTGGGAATTAEEPKPPTFSEQVTDVVFGDSPDDFLYLDQPDATGKPRIISQIETQQVYQSAPQETEMFGAPPVQGRPRMQDEPPVQDNPPMQDEPPMFEEPPKPIQVKEEPQQDQPIRQATPEEIDVEIVRVTKKPRLDPAPVQEIVEPEPVVMQKETAPIDIVAETRAEPVAEAVREVVKPAIDVVGMALSLAGQQSNQKNNTSGSQQQFQAMQQNVQSGSQSGGANYWGSAINQTRIAQAIAQQAQQQQSNAMTSVDLAPPSQAQFEDDFNDALATGQSVGQFLSAQPPDFSRFDVKPPSQQEQRTTQRASQAITTMTQTQVQQSTSNQLEQMQDSGGFTDQSLTVVLMGQVTGFTAYDATALNDKSDFYQSKVIYRGNRPADNSLFFLTGAGTQKYQSMVDEQWQR